MNIKKGNAPTKHGINYFPLNNEAPRKPYIYTYISFPNIQTHHLTLVNLVISCHHTKIQNVQRIIFTVHLWRGPVFWLFAALGWNVSIHLWEFLPWPCEGFQLSVGRRPPHNAARFSPPHWCWWQRPGETMRTWQHKSQNNFRDRSS